MPKVFIKKAPVPKAKNGASITPIARNMVNFSGPSHANGGMPIDYNGQKVEVEGGETGYKKPDNSLVIFGNMTVPGSDKKFKDVSKILADKEKKVSKLTDKGLQLVNASDPQDKWGELSFNSGKAMMMGGLKKQQELDGSKQHLADLQEAMLQTAGQLGADPQAFSKGQIKKAKYGATLKMAKAGYTTDPGDEWPFKGTNTKGLDTKIMDFVKMVQKKGLTGYSGEHSGVDQRNTSSGRLSRHAKGQALDMIFNDKDVYKKILKDPELTGYLVNNGLTAINEYDPKVAKKTGADVGHLHIGYDQGTPVADDFRSQAKKLYGTTNKDWAWNSRVNPSGTPLKGGKAGDAQDPQIVNHDYTPIPMPTFIPNTEGTPPFAKINAGPDYHPDITNPTNFKAPTNAKGMDLGQIAPELYALGTNQQRPVRLQQYNPQLYSPYQVSFQDRLNENQASFNSLQKVLSANPEALSTLAGQKYQADQQTLGDEFRTNQQIQQDITNKNMSLLNDAQQKNLELADQQYTRQEQARSNTRAINNTVLNSISSKLHQNALEQQTIKLYENLYPNFRFGADGQAQYYGPDAATEINWDGSATGSGSANQTTTQRYDNQGNLRGTSVKTPSGLNTQKENAQIYNTYGKMNPMTRLMMNSGQLPTPGNPLNGFKYQDYSMPKKENGGIIQMLKKR
jgi:hypothetical protein